MKKSIKFENVDILDALSKIVDLHTKHYREDFDLDKELIPKLALSPDPEDKHLFSIPTECAAIANGNDLRDLGIWHQQAFGQESVTGFPAQIRNLTEDCIACD